MTDNVVTVSRTIANGDVPAGKPKVDWDVVERHYRAGLLSIREIAKQHGCSDTAIRKMAAKSGWARDLTERVKERVRAELVRSEVRTANPQTEQDIVAEAAASVVALVREHRSDLKRGRAIVQTLFEQLDEAASHREDIEAAIAEETSAADDPNAHKGAQQAAWVRRGQMQRAVSLPSHAGVLRDLSTALKSLIPLEREAFGLRDGQPGEPGVTEPERVVTDYEALRRSLPDFHELRASPLDSPAD